MAIKALNSHVMNSKTVYICRRYPYEIVEKYDVHIVRKPRHNGILGNCTADELVSWGAPSNSPMNSRIPMRTWRSLQRQMGCLGYYNPSARIIDLVFRTTYVVC